MSIKSKSNRGKKQIVQGILYSAYPNKSYAIFRISPRLLATYASQYHMPQVFISWAGPSLLVRSIAVGTRGQIPHKPTDYQAMLYKHNSSV